MRGKGVEKGEGGERGNEERGEGEERGKRRKGKKREERGKWEGVITRGKKREGKEERGKGGERESVLVKELLHIQAP